MTCFHIRIYTYQSCNEKEKVNDMAAGGLLQSNSA